MLYEVGKRAKQTLAFYLFFYFSFDVWQSSAWKGGRFAGVYVWEGQGGRGSHTPSLSSVWPPFPSLQLQGHQGLLFYSLEWTHKAVLSSFFYVYGRTQQKGLLACVWQHNRNTAQPTGSLCGCEVQDSHATLPWVVWSQGHSPFLCVVWDMATLTLSSPCFAAGSPRHYSPLPCVWHGQQREAVQELSMKD